jgi:hypothetical protein
MSIRITQVAHLTNLCVKGEFDRVGQALVELHPIRAATLTMHILDQLLKSSNTDAHEKLYRYLIECENRLSPSTPVEETPVHDHMTIPEVILEVLHQVETHPKRSAHRTAVKLVALQKWINPMGRMEAVVLVNNYVSSLLSHSSERRHEVLKGREWPKDFKTPVPTPYPGKKTPQKKP